MFQLKSHAYMYESTPQQVIDEESHPGVLAEIMNSSSSSDDSDSTSSTSSDSSSGSHNTAKKRIKRAFRRRRKSSGSSTALPSVMSSPFTERASNPGESSTPPEENYFDRSRAQREASAAPAVFSGDEGDTDGENDRQEMEPQVRDFENEHGGGSSKSPPNRGERRGNKKKRKSHRNHKSKASEPKAERQNIPQEPILDEKDELAVQEAAPAHPRQVSIIDSPEIIPDADNNQPSQRTMASASPRRHFARQLSRPTFKPPPFLSNTVFTTPQPQPLGGAQAAGPSIAHRPGMRRTSSLPDRLNRQNSAARAQPQAASANHGTEAQRTRPGVLAVNTPDAMLKDEEDEKEPHMSRTAGLLLLVATTALVAFLRRAPC